MTDFIYKIQLFLNDELKNKDNLNVLEAGCGSLSKITFQHSINLTGIDISEKQLERNQTLKKKILGDLHSYDLGENIYDVIVCWDVLEHLDKPTMALDNMMRSLVPGGILLIKLPNVMSLKGLITKYTPHNLHVLYYKLVYKRPDAGKNDTGPFKSFLRYAISQKGFRKYAASRGFEIPFLEFADISETEYFLKRLKHSGIFKKAYRTANKLARLISFNTLDKSEMAVILRKPLTVLVEQPVKDKSSLVESQKKS